MANINGYIEEIYTGQAVVTSYNASKESSQDFKGLNDKLYNSMWQSQFISGIMMPLMIFIGNFGYVMVCLVGAVKVIDGSLTIGDVVAFMTYVRIFSQPLSQIAQGITQPNQQLQLLVVSLNFWKKKIWTTSQSRQLS